MPRAKSKVKHDKVVSTLSAAYSDMQSIRDELDDWYNNLPENFQSGDKGSAIEEAKSALDQNVDDEPTIPEKAADRDVSYFEWGGRIGRPKRRDNAVSMIDGAIESLSEYRDELSAIVYTTCPKCGHELTMDDDSTKPELSEQDRDQLVGELDELIDKLENDKAEWEAVEFPGMYG